MIEAMKRAYADRADFLGDPDSVKVPVAGLTSKSYADGAACADRSRARAAVIADIRAGEPAPREGDNTTHFSVIDRDGNAVSNTYTLNFSYGVGLVADGTGVLLNNELDDFAAKPMRPMPTAWSAPTPMRPGPGKRPLSSMTPTIVLKDGKPFLVTGSPGGSRIITTVLQIVTNVIDRGMTCAEAVTAPRAAPSMAAGRSGGRARHIARSDRGAAGARRIASSCGRYATSANSIVVTRRRLCRRGGSAHARRAGRGILNAQVMRRGRASAMRRALVPLATRRIGRPAEYCGRKIFATGTEPPVLAISPSILAETNTGPRFMAVSSTRESPV